MRRKVIPLTVKWSFVSVFFVFVLLVILYYTVDKRQDIAKTYVSNNKKFSISYPTDWQVIELDEKPNDYYFTSTIGLKKADAEFHAVWGNGLGGACPEELHADKLTFRQVRVECHYIQDGVEYWRFVSNKNYQLFSADAWVNTNSKNRKDILYILDNMAFHSK